MPTVVQEIRLLVLAGFRGNLLPAILRFLSSFGYTFVFD
jgi:hypothetical protein